MNKREELKSGFTLIELTLATAFISILLLTISLITREIVNLYRKGYSIKTVSQVGRDIIEDVTTSIIESPKLDVEKICNTHYTGAAIDACKDDNAQDFIYSQDSHGSNAVQVKGGDAVDGAPLSGVFCTGKYSYIWNTGYINPSAQSYTAASSKSLETTASDHYGFTVDGDGEFRLLKIEDPEFRICAATILPNENMYDRHYYDNTHNMNFDLNTIFSGLTAPEPVELISSSDTSLALYDFVIFPPAIDETTKRAYYAGSFILGTLEGGANIMSNGNYCSTTGPTSADFDYCALNKFNFATQASGSK
ncbi:hypothetical protein IJH89_01410 [Candidatus Saccharibacteria bacterium]|nr:hypothetical protein [Candidatus Saccharibacteria bacterium]